MVVSEARYGRWLAAAKREERKISDWLRLAADERAASKEMPPLPNRSWVTADGDQEHRIHVRVEVERKRKWRAAADRERRRSLSDWLRIAGDVRAEGSVKRRRRNR